MITVIIFILAGWQFLALLNYRGNIYERLGISYLLGFFMLTLPILGLTALRVRLTPEIITVVFAVIILLFLFWILKYKPVIHINPPKKMRDYIFPAILGVFILSSVFINNYWPPVSWDALTLYDFRAKLYANHELLGDIYRVSPNSIGYYFLDYPPTISLGMAMSYLTGQNPMYIFSGFYVALILFFYGAVLRFTPPQPAKLMTLALAGSTLIFYHSVVAYSNLAYTVTLVLGMINLEIFLEIKDRRILVIGMLLCGLSVWVRSKEPFFLVAPLLVGVWLLVKRLKVYWFIYLLWLGFVTVSPFIWYKYADFEISRTKQGNFIKAPDALNAGNNPVGSNTTPVSSSPEILSKVIYFDLRAIDIYIPLLLVTLASITGNLKKAKKYWLIPVTLLICLMLLVTGTWLISTQVSWWETIPDSVTRMMLFIIPCTLFSIIIILPINKYENRN